MIASSGKLPHDHYRVPVAYGPRPSFDELNGKLFDCASALHDGRFVWTDGFLWSGVEIRPQFDRLPRERIFFVKGFGREATSDHVFEWSETNGYRVALSSEAREFGVHATTRNLQRRYPIIALGSFTVREGVRYVTMLNDHSDANNLAVQERRFEHHWFNPAWHFYYRFLLIRKERKAA